MSNAFSQVLVPKSILLTLATGAKQPISAVSKLVRTVAIARVTGSAVLGDTSNQGMVSMAIACGDGKWVDLNTIYASGSAGDSVIAIYSDTFP